MMIIIIGKDNNRERKGNFGNVKLEKTMENVRFELCYDG